MSLLMAKLLGRIFQAEEDENSSGGGAEGTNNDARIALLNKIGEQSEGAREGEFEEKPEGDEAAAAQAEADAAALAAQQAADQAEVDAAALAASQASEKHKIKVNGVEEEMTTEELIAHAQKIRAGDQYLAEAARLRNELAAQRKPPEQDVSEQVDEDTALARAIQMGSEEEAREAIRKLRKQGPSQDDLARTIDERLTFNEAIAKFRTDYSDIASDAYLNKMAQDMDSELIRGGDKRPYDERYTEIGKKLRGWVDSKTKVPEKQSGMDKQARKEAAPAAPATAGGKATSSVEEEKEESTSEVIANMAKARGGPQWMQNMGG